MAIHQTYALSSRSDTNRFLRRWTSLSRAGFFSLALLSDVLVIVSLSWVTGVSYHVALYSSPGDVVSYIEVGTLAALVFVLPNAVRGEYKLTNFFAVKARLRRTVRLWNVTLICMLAIGFLAQVTVLYSRGWVLIYYFSTTLVLLAVRYGFVRLAVLGSRVGLISAQRIFLFGTGRYVEEFITRYEPRSFGVNIVGCQFLTPLDRATPAEVEQHVLERDLQAAVASARTLEPDAIFLLMPWSSTDKIKLCAETLLKLPAELHLGPEQVLDRYEDVQLTKIGPMVSLQLTRLPLSGLELFEKRAFDLLFSCIGLLLLTPVLVAAAIVIKLDSPGPVFFLQRRHGFNQKQFHIIKFRTMRALEDGPFINQAKKDDPRVTRAGAWLRRWSIDELPQLFNVILGDMSLVGPRPHALTHDHQYERRIAFYARRHNVKPGITGWAQIHGFRGETDTDEKMHQRVEHDLYYIDNWSLWLDLKIIFRTLLSRTSFRNAY